MSHADGIEASRIMTGHRRRNHRRNGRGRIGSPQPPLALCGHAVVVAVSRLGQTALARPYIAPTVYLVMLAVAEAATLRLPLAGLALHAILLGVALLLGAYSGNEARRALFWALALLPLFRLVSLASPLAYIPTVAWYALVSLPLFLAIGAAARALRYTRGDLGLGLSGRALLIAILMVPLGAVAGLVQYLIWEPRPLIPQLTLEAALAPALVLLIGTAVLEELAFRGLLQRATRQALGPAPGLLFAVALPLPLYLGTGSWATVAMAFILGLVFVLLTQRTTSLLPAIMGHASLNIALFLVVPFVMLDLLRAVPAPSGSGASGIGRAEFPWSMAETTIPVGVASVPLAAFRVASPASPPGAGLATPPFADAAVTALWIEPDVAPRRIGAGSDAGLIALSHDGGHSWTYRAGPTREPVRRIVISRFDAQAHEVHVLTPSGYYVSYDAGATWEPVRLAEPGEEFVDLVLSHRRNVIAAVGPAPLQIAETGEPFALSAVDPPPTRLVAVAAHTREDMFFGYDDAGRLLVTVPPGSRAMLPAGPAVAPAPGSRLPAPRPDVPLRVVLHQRFDAGPGAWPDAPAAGAAYTGGTYQITTAAPTVPQVVYAPLDARVRDFFASIAVRLAAGHRDSTYGFVVQRGPEGDSPTDATATQQYLFGVDGTGRLRVSYYGGQRWVDLLAPTFSPAARAAGAINDLTIQAAGPDLMFWLNGIPVAHVVDPAPRPGRVGVLALGADTTVALDEVAIYVPD